MRCTTQGTCRSGDGLGGFKPKPRQRVIALPLQIHRQFRKPLIVFSPKNLLRYPKCKSGLYEFDDLPDDVGIEVREEGRGFCRH